MRRVRTEGERGIVWQSMQIEKGHIHWDGVKRIGDKVGSCVVRVER